MSLRSNPSPAALLAVVLRVEPDPVRAAAIVEMLFDTWPGKRLPSRRAFERWRRDNALCRALDSGDSYARAAARFGLGSRQARNIGNRAD